MLRYARPGCFSRRRRLINSHKPSLLPANLGCSEPRLLSRTTCFPKNSARSGFHQESQGARRYRFKLELLSVISSLQYFLADPAVSGSGVVGWSLQLGPQPAATACSSNPKSNLQRSQSVSSAIDANACLRAWSIFNAMKGPTLRRSLSPASCATSAFRGVTFSSGTRG